MPTIGDLLTLHGQEPMISIDINSPRISGRPQHIQCDSRCHYLPHHPLNLRNQAPASPTSSVSSTFPFFSRYLSVDLGSSRTPLRRVAAASLFCFVSLEKDECPPTRIRTHALSVVAGPHFWITDQLHNPKAP